MFSLENCKDEKFLIYEYTQYCISINLAREFRGHINWEAHAFLFYLSHHCQLQATTRHELQVRRQVWPTLLVQITALNSQFS